MEAEGENEGQEPEGDSKFPDTLEGFGYTFKDGRLVHTETGKRYVFMVRPDDKAYNQRRYEALGDIVHEYVYNLMETEANLSRLYIPVDAKSGEPRSFVFVSADALTNTDKLMVIMQGSGAVRAGQWSRRLVINDHLDTGTQLPYIHRAKKEGYGVIVLNLNLNYIVDKEGTQIPIRENSSPHEHVFYVWDHIISKAAAKFVCIVAHSFGGITTVDLASKREEEFLSEVNSVAFTDGHHNIPHQCKSTAVHHFFNTRCMNWVTSTTPLDTDVTTPTNICPRHSGGTMVHEMTNWTCFDLVFKFFQDMYEKPPETNGAALAVSNDCQLVGRRREYHVETYKEIRQLVLCNSEPLKSKPVSEPDFPDTIEGFGYTFKDGKLVDIETGEGYVFDVKPGDDVYNQKRYDALGELLHEYVYQLMENEANLYRLYIPTDVKNSEPRSFVYASTDARTNTDKLMVIMQGLGVARAGQWSRSMIIHEDLKTGTQLSYIQRAQREGYGVIVTNLNFNHVIDDHGNKIHIRENSTPLEHSLSVWDHIISQAAAKFVSIVTHSYSGRLVVDMADKKGEPFVSKISSIAILDGFHDIPQQSQSKDVHRFFNTKCMNWASSTAPLGTDLTTSTNICPRRSGGTTTHQRTIHTCFDEVFLYFQEMYQKTVQTSPKDDL